MSGFTGTRQLVSKWIGNVHRVTAALSRFPLQVSGSVIDSHCGEQVLCGRKATKEKWLGVNWNLLKWLQSSDKQKTLQMCYIQNSRFITYYFIWESLCSVSLTIHILCSHWTVTGRLDSSWVEVWSYRHVLDQELRDGFLRCRLSLLGRTWSQNETPLEFSL